MAAQLDVAVAAAITSFVVVLFLVSSMANTLLLFIFFKRASLRTLSNRFVINLVISNTVSTFVLLPGTIADSFFGASVTNCVFCHLLDGVTTLVVGSSSCAVFCISVDRYFAVLDPLRYHTKITKARASLMLWLTWAIPALVALFDGLARPFENQWQSCSVTSLPGLHYFGKVFNQVYVTLMTLLVFVVPWTMQVWMYSRIYKAAHENSERARRSSLCSSAVDIVHSMSRNNSSLSRNASVLSRSPSTLASRVRHRISNANMFYKEEGRAAKLSILIILNLFASWTPYFLYGMIQIYSITNVPQICFTICIVLILTNGTISPFLYAFHSKRMVREARRVLGLRNPSCPNPRFQRSLSSMRAQRKSESSLPKNLNENDLLMIATLKFSEKLGSTEICSELLPRNFIMDHLRVSISSGSSQNSESTQSSTCTTESV